MIRKIPLIIAGMAAPALAVLSLQGAAAVAAPGSGAIWQIVPSPNPGTFPTLLAVAASSASDAWTVGWYGSFETLTEHWNGSSWSVANSPNPGGYDRLSGVAVVPGSTQVWAEGIQAAPTGNYQILTELYC